MTEAVSTELLFDVPEIVTFEFVFVFDAPQIAGFEVDKNRSAFGWFFMQLLQSFYGMFIVVS